jgi:CRP-like cAMP-binding protein
MSASVLPTNLLLLSLSPSTRASLLKHATAVELPLATALYEEATVPRYAWFLLSGLASIVTAMPNGESVEIGFIGREGMVGSLHLLGPASLSTRCMMQMSGSALRVPFAEAKKAFDEVTEVRNRILEFVQEQSAVVEQIAGCNRIHDAEQRLIRWLLMAQDRTDYDTLDFTQEYLSEMIGTQRTTVTVIAGDLQRRGLIRYSRGRIHILNRPGLEASACACDGIVRQLFQNLYRNGAPGSQPDGSSPPPRSPERRDPTLLRA